MASSIPLTSNLINKINGTDVEYNYSYGIAKPHGFCRSHPFQTYHIYIYIYIAIVIQKPHIEPDYLPHANVFGNYEGFVNNLEDVLESHRRCTMTSYGTRNSKKSHQIGDNKENDSDGYRYNIVSAHARLVLVF